MIPSFCILHPYQVPTVFISIDASYHALFAQFLKEDREQICFKFFSEYEIKQSFTWRELFAIQFSLPLGICREIAIGRIDLYLLGQY